MERERESFAVTHTTNQDVRDVLFNMEDDVHRVVGLAEALRGLGCVSAKEMIPADAIIYVAEALTDAAEAVRESWRKALELCPTQGGEQ
jgi:hypothetical protein